MKLIRKPGATSQIFQVFIQDTSSTTGAGLTGLTNASGSLTAYYHRDTDTTATAISLVTMTVGTFTSSGFKEIDSTNMPGVYQFCPPNAAMAAGATSVIFFLKGATNMAPLPIEVDLQAQVDVSFINAVSTSSVTTINANIGQTQPVNFTGTGGSALVKSDMVDVAGAAVATGTAQIGVNVVNIAGQTVTAAAGVTFPSSVASPTNITAGTITTVTNLTNAPTSGDLTAAMIASVTTAATAATPTAAAVTAAVTVSGTSPLTEAYASKGAALTLASALYGMHQQLGERSTSGTTITVKKRDQSTTAQTFMLDDATTTTSIAQAT
jgi:hypothetical protein